MKTDGINVIRRAKHIYGKKGNAHTFFLGWVEGGWIRKYH
jgi:hypothetical protein